MTSPSTSGVSAITWGFPKTPADSPLNGRPSASRNTHHSKPTLSSRHVHQLSSTSSVSPASNLPESKNLSQLPQIHPHQPHSSSLRPPTDPTHLHMADEHLSSLPRSQQPPFAHQPSSISYNRACTLWYEPPPYNPAAFTSPSHSSHVDMASPNPPNTALHSCSQPPANYKP
ncbi:hypothetical protein WN944_026683 [Citrus x changshan-huyou]|uniref:Uncharacterized protein n=1 Tax=Citrus x changshan-huyou TaxID=2935761 RepID=A0AAP0QES8_9ROSI